MGKGLPVGKPKTVSTSIHPLCLHYSRSSSRPVRIAEHSLLLASAICRYDRIAISLVFTKYDLTIREVDGEKIGLAVYGPLPPDGGFLRLFMIRRALCLPAGSGSISAYLFIY